MNLKILKQMMYLILLFLSIQLVSAANMTIQGLIDSYDYNFTTTGTFNVNATAKNGTLTDSRNLSITI